jgi:hypothetical protein
LGAKVVISIVFVKLISENKIPLYIGQDKRGIPSESSKTI